MISEIKEMIEIIITLRDVSQNGLISGGGGGEGLQTHKRNEFYGLQTVSGD